MDPEKKYEEVRTEANTFMNRNWWWVVLAVLAFGAVAGAIFL